MMGAMASRGTASRRLAFLPLLPLLALLPAGCGPAGLGGEEEARYREAPRQAAERSGRDEPEAGAPAAPQGLSGGAGGDAQPLAVAAAAASVEKPGERKRIYSGFVRLVVEELEQSRRELARFAESNGGYVESSQGSTVVLRVPAARFRELFEAVLDMGEPAYKSIETRDVSDAIRELRTRLRVKERTRSRLYTLLERSSEAKERLAILREIRRLTEEIERIRLELESLNAQMAFSRITVELVPRLPVGQTSRDGIPFRWIAALDPVRQSLPRLAGRVSLPLGEEFAVLERRRSFRAESAEGTRVRVGSTRNEPAGDELFWQKALLHHLAPLYRSAEELEAKGLRGVLFTSKDRRPYSYLVGLRVVRGSLYVVEAFFPDQEAQEKRLAGIRDALGALEVKRWPW